MKKEAYFITGTDTNVGKTVATLALGLLYKEKGRNVGVMKPVQCAGEDARFLKETLEIDDPLDEINPYYADEPLSPNVAFKRQKTKINLNRIKKNFENLKNKHDVLLVEGAGGVEVPIKDGYVISDLIKDLNLDVIVVSRLGLGTINHTLLTINQIRQKGLKVKGVIFNAAKTDNGGTLEKTNQDIIRKFGKVPVLGTIPYMEKIDRKSVLAACKNKIQLKGTSRKKSTRHKQLIKDDKKYLWHPFTQMQDWLREEHLVIEKGEGSFLIDADGKRYLDGVSSLWVNVHGHRQEHIDRSVKDQIDQLSHSTLLGLSNVSAIKLAKELIRITPHGLEKVFYSDSGSTAVEIAIKMAYQYWQNIGKGKKTKLVHMANSYHGDTLGSVSVGGIKLFHKVYRNLIFKTIEISFPDCYRSPKGKRYPDYAFECVDKFEQLIRKCHQEIAAFVVEPIVQGAAGMIVWPKGVLKRLREICRKYDVIFITDEVATGFGRTGKMFACEHEDVKPDIMCLAKGLTGGYLPLAATLTTEKIYEGFLFDHKEQKTFFHGHTYTGNPLACAAGLANLEVFKKERTLAKLAPKIKYLSKRLDLFYNLGSVGSIRQFGFMVGIELVKDRAKKTPFDWQEKIGVKVCQKIREKGVILRPLGNVIVLMPPLSMTKQELKKLLDVTYWAIKDVTEF